MTTAPRPRQRASTSQWPQLSLLTVYADRPLLDAEQRHAKLDDADLEAARVLYFEAPLEPEKLDPPRRNRIMGTITGVQGFTSGATHDVKINRTLAPAGSTDVRAVHSTRRRMVWYEVEQGFYVHATVQLPRPSRRERSASTSTAADAAPLVETKADIRDEGLIAALRQSHRRFRLLNGEISAIIGRDGKEELVRKLERHWRDWRARFDLGKTASLEQIIDAVPHSALLTPATKIQLQPLMTQFAASNPSALPVLLHGREVLALPKLPPIHDSTLSELGRPPPPSLDEDELVDLARYLADLVPESTVLAVSAEPSAAQGSHISSSVDAVSNAWSSSLSTLANGMSFLSPRPLNLSLSSLPGVSGSHDADKSSSEASPKNLRAGFAALRRQEKAALAATAAPSAPATAANGETAAGAAKTRNTSRSDASTGTSSWSLRRMGWSNLGLGGTSPADEAKAAAEASARSVQPSSAPDTLAMSDTRGEHIETEAGDERDVGTASEAPTNGIEPRREDDQPSTPGIELAPAVNAAELAEAIGTTPEQQEKRLEIVAVRAEQPPGERRTSLDEHEYRKVLDVFVGGVAGTTARCQLRRYRRGTLTLGLLVLPSTDEAATAWLDSRAARLLEAVETMTELVKLPEAAYPHRHIVKTGPALSSLVGADVVSTSAEDAAAIDRESTAALLRSHELLNRAPVVVESLTRLASAQWAVHRQQSLSADPALAVTQPIEVYAVTPSKTSRGREFSLVDAADELRQLERAYERM